MGFSWTSDYLVSSVKRRAMLAANDATLSDDNILEFLDEEVQTYIVPTLIGVSEEFLVSQTDIDIAANQSVYDIPARAVGRELRDVRIANTSSGDNTSFIQLKRIEPENDPMLLNSGIVAGYMFRGDHIILTPTPSYAGTLRLLWFNRPNKMVTVADAAVIQSINAGRTVITTSATIPSTFTTGISVDIVNNKPGFSSLVMDATTTATTSGTTITLTEALPSTVVAGQYVCLAQEAPLAQIPPDLYPLLAERVAAKCLEALGDPRAEVQRASADAMEERTLKLLTPRSKGSARPIVSRYGPGQMGWWSRFGWRNWQ